MLSSNDKATPGQPFKAPPAEVWNGMVDAGNAYRANLISSPTPDRKKRIQTDVIRLKNSSGADRARGEILRFNGKAIEELDNEFIWLIGSTPTDDDFFGILKDPIESNAVGLAQVSGCCMATVNVTDANHTRAKSANTLHLLQSGDDGPIEILYKPSGTGELECVVRFGAVGGGGVTLYRFTLNEDWSSLAADADILEMDGTDTGTDADVLDPLGIFGTLGIGDAGLCLLQNGVYYAIQAPCPSGS